MPNPKKTAINRGRSFEQFLARAFGGQRIGISGRATIDVMTPTLAIEAKEKEHLPKWIMSALALARSKALDGQTPILVLHQLGNKHDDDLVVLRLEDFMRGRE